MRVRLATYNIRKGGRRRSHLIAEVLRSIDPDVVVLQEAVDPRVVREVAATLGARVVTSAPGRSVAVLSRLADLEVEWLHHPGGPGFVHLEIPSAGVRLLGLHLSAGLSGRGERKRTREIEHVLTVARGGPGLSNLLITGDFNAVARGDLPAVARMPAWIRVLLRVDGGISTVVMDRLLSTGLVDAFRRLNPAVPGGTIPSGAPSVRLDYFLVAPGLMPCVVACGLGVADPGLLAAASDHLPLVLELDGAKASHGLEAS